MEREKECNWKKEFKSSMLRDEPDEQCWPMNKGRAVPKLSAELKIEQRKKFITIFNCFKLAMNKWEISWIFKRNLKSFLIIHTTKVTTREH